MNTPIKRYALALLLPLVLASCNDRAASDEHGHAHGEEDKPTLVYTDYSDTTELFLKFPALVAGQSSTFVAHVTRLHDYTALTSGTVDVLLLEQGKTVARFRVKEPARAGIFTPAVKPRDPGTFELALEIQDQNLKSRHQLGTVTVFPDAASVKINQPEREGDIGYQKEQQWMNPFAAVVAEPRPLRPSVPGFATVRAPADAGAEIRAPADGYFTAANLVRAGDTVRAGDVLGYLVPRLGEGADFGNLTVELERARSQMTLAERDVKRLEGLFQQGAVPERRLLEARQALEVARAEITAARARVNQGQRGNATSGIALRSPVSGEVIDAQASPGAFVRTGERVFQIAAPDRRWLEVRVPERFAGELKQSTGAWIELDSGEVRELDPERGARVVQVSTAIDPVTRTAGVTLEYPATEGPTLVGARFPAHVFNAAPEPRLAVPRSAVLDDGGRQVVYVQSGGEMFVRRPVELGRIDGPWVEVLSGLEPGERVVAKGAYYVKLAATGGDDIGHGHAH